MSTELLTESIQYTVIILRQISHQQHHSRVTHTGTKHNIKNTEQNCNNHSKQIYNEEIVMHWYASSLEMGESEMMQYEANHFQIHKLSECPIYCNMWGSVRAIPIPSTGSTLTLLQAIPPCTNTREQ